MCFHRGLSRIVRFSAFRRIRSYEQVAHLATKGSAHFLQDVPPVHARSVMEEPEQRGIGNTRLHPQPIQRPLFSFQDFSKPAHDHGRKVATPSVICQVRVIYEVYFTYDTCRSKVAPRPRGLGALSVPWETAAAGGPS
jgi:hypothetical protein